MQIKKMVDLAIQACEEKKGEEIAVLDLRKHNSIASFFVIASGNSDRHVRAIADNVVDRLEEKKVWSIRTEGKEDGRWILLDFGGLIVHVFYHETRKFYNLERLWGTTRLAS